MANRVTTDKQDEGLNRIKSDGQQEKYLVLSPEERSKGFVRPVRHSYIHTCGSETSMGRSLAETYARDPKFYTGTYCLGCKAHFPVSEFTWSGTDEVVGSKPTPK